MKKRVCWQMPEAEIIAVTPTASSNKCSKTLRAKFFCESDLFEAAAQEASVSGPSEEDVLAMALDERANDCQEESFDEHMLTIVGEWTPEHDDSGDLENNPNLGNLRVELGGVIWDAEKEAADLSRTVVFPRRRR